MYPLGYEKGEQIKAKNHSWCKTIVTLRVVWADVELMGEETAGEETGGRFIFV